MYEYSFITVIMIFEYHSKTFSKKYTFGVLEIVRCDVESSEVFHIVDNINIQLGPNWQPSTTKMTVARLRCNANSFESVSYH